MKLCLACKKRPKHVHRNSKYCLQCRTRIRRAPRGKLSADQARLVRKYAGTMFIKKLAEKVGTSDSNLDRWAKQNGVSVNALKYPEATVKAVTAYYAKHGKAKTVERFPGIRVRSIFERYNKTPRQIRWKDSEIVLAAKMAGLVDGKRQARIFNRPGANEGSIKSLWMKRFKHGGGNVHGMSEWMAKQILKPGYPLLKTRVWSPRKGAKNRNGPVRGIVLWCDMVPHLKRGTPRFIREGVKTMAKFQRWLFEAKDPKREILKVMRDACDGYADKKGQQ